MDQIVFLVSGTPVRLIDLVLGAGGLALVLLVIVTVALLRVSRAHAVGAAASAERQREIDDKMAELNKASAELAGRMQTVAEVLGSRQSDLARHVSERLDAVGHRVGQGLEQAARTQTENLGKLNERLAVIDAAQTRLSGLAQEVVGLKDILANKQARGAYGQGRMEAIVRDGLPPSAYDFQATLSSRVRPDCVVRLPGDERVLAIDAKFPLEGFTAFREAKSDDERTRAASRVRSDILKHVKDISEKYLIPGETQDLAVLFVPSEAVYADLSEHFDEIVQKAHRARVLIVSPSLLMMAIQVMQAIVRDARVREQAHIIQDEVRRLVDDVKRLRDRVGKLDTHFRQAGDDLAAIVVSADKALKRGDRIDQMDFAEPAALPAQRDLLGGARAAAE
ncbi:MAG: DNA recombination protein RmuC [Hyphomicrobiales bacterium]|nr:DNA recombination protein RmuC [Hyphomicrobiales bacterium]